jgi:peptide/nickel transport system ATP-binding protein
MNLLELINVTKVFKAGGITMSKNLVTAVDSVSFAMPLDKPVIYALVGESGSGKTTISRMILNLLPPTYGEILYKGRNLKSLGKIGKNEKKDYTREVQPIFQDPYSAYNPFYRVEHIFDMVLEKFKLAPSKSEGRQMMIKAMEDIGLRPSDILGRHPHQLSGGERQRLMLARILILKPKLVIADEPVSMIDASLRAIFLNQLILFKEKLGTSCMYITHDLNMTGFLSDRILVLCHGRIVEEGPTSSVIEDPLHPYTKLLIDCIPAPDPNDRYKGKLELETTKLESMGVGMGCVFSTLCPHSTERCTKEDQRLVPVGPDRRVACLQYSN